MRRIDIDTGEREEVLGKGEIDGILLPSFEKEGCEATMMLSQPQLLYLPD